MACSPQWSCGRLMIGLSRGPPESGSLHYESRDRLDMSSPLDTISINLWSYVFIFYPLSFPATSSSKRCVCPLLDPPPPPLLPALLTAVLSCLRLQILLSQAAIVLKKILLSTDLGTHFNGVRHALVAGACNISLTLSHTHSPPVPESEKW